MKLRSRRQFLHLAAGAAALPAVSRIARAQSYPLRPVRLNRGARNPLAQARQRLAFNVFEEMS